MILVGMICLLVFSKFKNSEAVLGPYYQSLEGGTGTSGSGSDSVPATSSALSSPFQVFHSTYSAINGILVADNGNNRIKKIDTNGLLTYYGGSSSPTAVTEGVAATSVFISKPSGVSVDSNGNTYVSSDDGYRVFKFAANTFIASTYVGVGTASPTTTGLNGDNGPATSASVKSPYLIYASAGSLYVVDYDMHRVRTISASGIIITICGTGTATTQASSGIATQAALNKPTGVFVDTNSKVYLTEEGGHYLKMITATGIISVLAGGGTASSLGSNGPASSAKLNYPNGVHVDTSGNIFIAEYSGHNVRVIEYSTSIIYVILGTSGSVSSLVISAMATSTAIGSPSGLFVDTLGTIHVTDNSASTGGSNVRRAYSLAPTLTPTLKPTTGPTLTPSVAPSFSLVPSLNPTMVPTVIPSVEPSVTPSVAPTIQPSIIPSMSPSGDPSLTPSSIPTIIPSIGPTVLPSALPTLIPTTIPSLLPTPSPSLGPTVVPTVTPSIGPTVFPTVVPTMTPTTVPTTQPTVIPSSGPTATPSIAPTVVPSLVPSVTPSVGPSLLPSVIPSMQPSVGPSVIPTAGPTVIPTIVPSLAPTRSPSCVPSMFPSVGPTVAPSDNPSTQPSVAPTVVPSTLPSILPSLNPTVDPTVLPSTAPTLMPSTSPSLCPTEVPTVGPSILPTVLPTVVPTVVPSIQPSVIPSLVPSLLPSVMPSILPSVGPSFTPSMLPSDGPTVAPSDNPSIQPSVAPTAAPSSMPSTLPSVVPTVGPSAIPSIVPSVQPTESPTGIPTPMPSSVPTQSPSLSPSTVPTVLPSFDPTVAPSEIPSDQPSVIPSTDPTMMPSAAPIVVPSLNPSVGPSVPPSLNPSLDPTLFPTEGPTVANSGLPSMKPSLVPSVNPSGLPTVVSGFPTQNPSLVPSSLPIASVSPTDAPSVVPSTIVSVGPTAASKIPTLVPSSSPTMAPSVPVSSSNPNVLPSTVSEWPSRTPSSDPSESPVSSSSLTPSMKPSVELSVTPSTVLIESTIVPSNTLTDTPSNGPTMLPSFAPSTITDIPTVLSSGSPSLMVQSLLPTAFPTFKPSVLTPMPTLKPSTKPSLSPTGLPIPTISFYPTSPTVKPTRAPTIRPSIKPSRSPSVLPSIRPIASPSVTATATPSAYATIVTVSVAPSLSVIPTICPSIIASMTPSVSPSSSPPTTTHPTTVPTTVTFYEAQPKATLPSNQSISVIGSTSTVRFKIVLPFLSIATGPLGPAFNDITLPSGDPSMTCFIVNGGASLVGELSSLLADVFVGAGAFDSYKRSISMLTDVNGDLIDDLIIGDPYAARCYVLFGTEFGLTNMTRGFTIFGETEGDFTGWSVSGAGDVNNDTLPDILIGAPNVRGVGAVYIIFGRSGNMFDVHLNNLTATIGFAIYGSLRSDYLGISVSNVGDVNGDHCDDIIVGGVMTAAYDAGAAFVIYGGRSVMNLKSVADLTFEQGFKLTGTSYSYVGYSVSSAGDVNRDGLMDVLIGSAPIKSQSAVTYLVYGFKSPTDEIQLNSMPSDTGIAIAVGGGGIVSYIGDVNLDGYDDVMIGGSLLGSSESRSGVIVYLDISHMLRISDLPTKSPTYPAFVPSARPSRQPSKSPSVLPTRCPSAVPSITPSGPTSEPSLLLSAYPTSPTVTPSVDPTEAPTLSPSQPPSEAPSTVPTTEPSEAPTVRPTPNPSFNPTFVPTAFPSTVQPTVRMASHAPFSAPSMLPTAESSVKEYVERYIITSELLTDESMGHQNYVINCSCNVTIDNRLGFNKYTILPNAGSVLTVSYFNNTNDIIDLTAFTAITEFNQLVIVEGSVIVTLFNEQTIHILNLHPVDMTAGHFIFFKNPVKEDGGSITRTLSVIAGCLIGVGGLIIGAVLTFRLFNGSFNWLQTATAGESHRHFLMELRHSKEGVLLTKNDNNDNNDTNEVDCVDSVSANKEDGSYLWDDVSDSISTYLSGTTLNSDGILVRKLPSKSSKQHVLDVLALQFPGKVWNFRSVDIHDENHDTTDNLHQPALSSIDSISVGESGDWTMSNENAVIVKQETQGYEADTIFGVVEWSESRLRRRWSSDAAEEEVPHFQHWYPNVDESRDEHVWDAEYFSGINR